MRRWTRREFSALLGSGLLGAMALPGSSQQAPAWNVLMITNDQHRADCLGCMGNPVIQTPSIDRLASQGVIFEDCFVQAPQCVPSRAAMLTGQFPHADRVPSNRFQLAPSAQTLMRVLDQAGYETAEIGEPPFAPTHYTDGFQRIVAGPKEYNAFRAAHGWGGPNVSPERRAALEAHQQLLSSKTGFQAAPVPWPAQIDETAFFAESAISFLRQPRTRPFFLDVNFRRPHHPFDPPAPYDSMYASAHFPPSWTKPDEMRNKPPEQQRALHHSVGFDLTTLTPALLHRIKNYYYGMISLNDHYIGKILDELERSGLADRTVVVFNADHGEMLGDHGLLFKGPYFYDQLVRVPLIVRAPGRLPAGRRVSDLVEEIDLMPSLLDLLGIAAPDTVQGRSFIPLAESRGHGREAVYSEFPAIKMIRTKEWKLVHYVRHPEIGELYDLTSDPHELTNLYGLSPVAAIQERLENQLMDWLATTQYPGQPPLLAR